MPLSTDSSRSAGQGIPSGIDPIEREWGGLYRGGAYLVYGRASSGRGIFTLRFVAAGLEHGDRCLFVASERFRDLAVEASSIGLDLRRARMQGLVQLTRVPPIVSGGTDPDAAVAEAMSDLSALVRREKPERVVVNDFLPFVTFQSFDRLRRAFVDLLESLDGVDSTLLLALPEPANDQSTRVVQFISTKLTGTVHVEPFEYDPLSNERRLTLTPHVGHMGGRAVCRWDLARLVQLPSEPAGVPVAEAPPPHEPAVAAPKPPPPEPVHVETPEPAEAPQPEAPAPAEVPETLQPEAPAPAVEADEPDSDRAAYRDALQSWFDRREQGGVPFLLLAMRLDRENGGATRPFDFEFVIDLVRDNLRSQDSVLVDPESERLVVCLADSTSEDAQDFFARLRKTLEAEAPQRAGQLLQAVSAIVVPDGRPFDSAGEFLAYALDES